MKYQICGFVFWVVIIVLIEDAIGTTQNRAFDESYSLTSILNPLEMVKTARRLVSNGVQKYRENLDEGSRDGQILKEDSNEGVPRSGDEDEDPSSFQESTEDVEIPRDGNMLGGIFRLMGVDSSSLGMVVLNVLIFFAEMVTKSILGKNSNSEADTRMLKENLLEWLLEGENEKVDKVFHEARDRELPESLISMLQNKTGNQTACIQLLICKMSPFIWSIQTTLNEQLKSNENGTRPFDARHLMNFGIMDQLFTIFPDRSKFISFGDDCEKRLPNCKLPNPLTLLSKNDNKNEKENS